VRERITADTNLLLRAVLGDDPGQSPVAKAQLANAAIVAITPVTLCEFVWVLLRGLKVPRDRVVREIETLLAIETVVTDRPAALAGLDILLAGGDFADGMIAYQGESLGADIFASFDLDAVRRIQGQGKGARSPT
jgi:predicted nucleic-acid-binding protein